MGDRERGYAHRVDIRADVDAVWRALTEADYLMRWCSPGAQIAPRPGRAVSAPASTG